MFTIKFSDDEPRRPGQRLPTSMLGNEVMSKEQLYDLFQQVLNVKKFEHQLLYNAMQVLCRKVKNKRKMYFDMILIKVSYQLFVGDHICFSIAPIDTS